MAQDGNLMEKNREVGQIIGGNFDRIIARESSNAKVEIGELLTANSEDPGEFCLLQVVDILYSSQLSQQNLELISGLSLEDNQSIEFLDAGVRNYNIILLKNLLSVRGLQAFTAKKLPVFFSGLKRVSEEDLKFLEGQGNLFVGNLRSGSREMEQGLFVDASKVLSHHVLVSAQTGKGKSNFTKCILERALQTTDYGILVLDPHDEYFGRAGKGLKDSRHAGNLHYYSMSQHPKAQPLRIRLDELRPEHFQGIFSWSQAQEEAILHYYRRDRKNWIEDILKEEDNSGTNGSTSTSQGFHTGTINVLKRRLSSLLSIDYDAQTGTLISKGMFIGEGASSIPSIVNALETGNIVIIDTSSFTGAAELLIGSIIASSILSRYRNYKMSGKLEEKPVISIVIEEAPRVLGKAVLQQGNNVFETIAREGRKFNVGLFAITQVPSTMQREILANMNTKIILGLEMNLERNAIIESAAQDISDMNSAIASLEKGEAIITSSFTRFAVPIKAPLFERMIEESSSNNDADRTIPQAGTRVEF